MPDILLPLALPLAIFTAPIRPGLPFAAVGDPGAVIAHPGGLCVSDFFVDNGVKGEAD
jgi:hypothetical protein